MSEFSKLKCEACRAGAPLVTAEELNQFLSVHSSWTLTDFEGVSIIQKTFKFGNFVDALAFTNTVGDMAEKEGHHPALLTEWGKVTVKWWTHKISGLHLNDLIMGARTDELYESK
ncbi:MAG: 4a-hydroxytetrahydrobiopterin dehydratase [Acidiferrobacteraceae bacterium]|nr:4a-hydroxytetrahydrobiopterin dehydratase [Acidiferrobacteraceae bacterium]|tara:strand:+ start:387 stop:731 length:345 start_codon:yes stop_codon:yes gene_type:complete